MYLTIFRDYNYILNFFFFIKVFVLPIMEKFVTRAHSTTKFLQNTFLRTCPT